MKRSEPRGTDIGLSGECDVERLAREHETLSGDDEKRHDTANTNDVEDMVELWREGDLSNASLLASHAAKGKAVIPVSTIKL
jgi:hypothetical protein